MTVERDLCIQCDAELTSADYEAGECTQCGGLITMQRSDEDERSSNSINSRGGSQGLHD